MSETPAPDPAGRATLYRLRMVAAGFCKDLMRARLVRDPGGFTDDELRAWKIPPARPPEPEWRYLRWAADRLGWLLDRFAWEHHVDSVGDDRELTLADRVIQGCVWLVPREAEERVDVWVRRLAGRVGGGSAEPWWEEFPWAELDELRGCLNLLPEDESAAGPEVRWDEGAGKLSVDGQVVLELGGQATNQRAVLRAFQNPLWPPAVPSPFARTEDGRRTTSLEDAVRKLNRAQSRVRFRCDGSGDRVLHEVVADDSEEGSTASQGD